MADIPNTLDNTYYQKNNHIRLAKQHVTKANILDGAQAVATAAGVTIASGGRIGASVSIGSGFAITGDTLTATVSGLVGGETVTYQWTDDGDNISGATAVTYSPTIGVDSVADASRMRCVATVDGTPYTSNSRVLAYAAGTAPAIADGQAFVVGTAVNIDASASGANLTFTYALSGAPAGVSINASTGAIIGDPTTVETGTVTVTPTDQYGRTYPDTFTFGVTAAPISETWIVTGHSIGDDWTIEAGLGNDGPEDLAIEDGITLTWTSSTGPTAAALGRYNGRTTINGVNLQTALDAGGDYLVGMEGMNDTTGLDTYVDDFGSPPALAYEGALTWHEAAQTAGLSEHFYVRWAGSNTSYGGVFGQAWRDRITEVAWDQHDGIKTYVDANKSGALPFTWVYLDAAFAVLFDRIQAGTYTQFAIGDFFGDNVHPSTDLGQWFSCVFVWHSIRGTDPAAYPLTLGGMAGSITSAQRAEIVNLIVDVAADPFLAFALAAPVITGVPTVSGTAQVGETLTITLASVSGNPTPTSVVNVAGSGDFADTDVGTSFVIPAGAEGETLVFTQVSTNSEDSDSASSTATGTIAAAATVPAQMTAPAVTSAGETSISVDRAAAPSDGGSTITSYDLRWSTDEATWTTVAGIADPETVASLTASTLYYAQTRAVNAVGAGAWSASGSATTDAAAGGVDDPSTIMGANSLAWLDPQDTATMFNTVTGTGAITTDGDLVGRIVDQEGSVNFDAAANNATRPIYRTANGGYLEGVEASDTLIEGTVSRSGAFYVAARMRLRALTASTAEKFAVFYASGNSPWWNGPATAFVTSNVGSILVTEDGPGPASSISLNTWVTVEILYDTDSRIVGVDGTDEAENTDTFAPPATGILALFSAPGEGGADIDIGRIAVASALPTAQERIDMREWLEA